MADFSFIIKFNKKPPVQWQNDPNSGMTTPDWFKTLAVPMVDPQVKPDSAAKLKDGNVPFVAPEADSDMTGLVIEKSKKSAQAEEVKEVKEEKTSKTPDETSKKAPQKASKQSRTLDEAMRIAYPKWDKMSDEDKEKQIINHLNSLDKKDFDYLATKENPDGRVGWLKSFLTNDRMNDKERQLTVGALKQLNVKDSDLAKVQAQGVKMVFDDDNLNRKVLQEKVVEDMDAYGKMAQKVAVKYVSTSEFDAIKVSGSLKIAKLDEDLQTSAVEQFRGGAKTSSKEIQKVIDGKIVGQYQDFAKNSQVDIHKIMMGSDFQEILEQASASVYKFHKDNQVAAAKVTVASDNEGAMKAMAATINKFDKDNQGEVANYLNNSGYKSVRDIVSKSYHATQYYTTVAASESEGSDMSSSAGNSSDRSVNNNVKKITNAGLLKKAEAIRKLLTKGTSAQIGAYMRSGLSYDIMTYLTQSASSTEIQDFLNKVGNLSVGEKTELQDALKKSEARYMHKSKIFDKKKENNVLG